MGHLANKLAYFDIALSIFFLTSGVHNADVASPLSMAVEDGTGISSPDTTYSIRIKIINRTYNTSLSNSKSADYKHLRKEIDALFRNAFPSDTDYRRIRQMTFSNGSVIAKSSAAFGTNQIDPYLVKHFLNNYKSSSLELQPNFTKVLPPLSVRVSNNTQQQVSSETSPPVDMVTPMDPTGESSGDSQSVTSSGVSQRTTESNGILQSTTMSSGVSPSTTESNENSQGPPGSSDVSQNTTGPSDTPQSITELSDVPQGTRESTSTGTEFNTLSSQSSDANTEHSGSLENSQGIGTSVPPSPITVTDDTLHSSDVPTNTITNNSPSPFPNTTATTTEPLANTAAEVSQTTPPARDTTDESNLPTTEPTTRHSPSTLTISEQITTSDIDSNSQMSETKTTAVLRTAGTTPGTFFNTTTPSSSTLSGVSLDGTATPTPLVNSTVTNTSGAAPSSSTPPPTSKVGDNQTASPLVAGSVQTGVPGWGIALLVLAAIILLLLIILIILLVYYCCCGIGERGFMRVSDPTPYMPFNPDIPMYSTQSTIDLHNGKAFDDTKNRSGRYVVNPSTRQ